MKNDRLMMSGQCEWTQIKWKQFNWISMTFIKVYFEVDRRFGNLELHLGLLGFTAYICWTYNPIKMDKEIKKLRRKSEWI